MDHQHSRTCGGVGGSYETNMHRGRRGIVREELQAAVSPAANLIDVDGADAANRPVRERGMLHSGEGQYDCRGSTHRASVTARPLASANAGDTDVVRTVVGSKGTKLQRSTLVEQPHERDEQRQGAPRVVAAVQCLARAL
jgi:hypothetical protein